MGTYKNIPTYWGTEYYNCSLAPGRFGKYAIKITNEKPQMSLGAQTVNIDWEKTPKISVSCWIKLDNVVPGKEYWNRANLQVLFYDGSGNQLGGWPELGKWEGTFGWRKAARNFFIPKGTVKAKIIFGLYDCTGTVYFDNIVLSPLVKQEKSDPYNLLQNGSLELWEGWAYGGSDDWGIVFYDVKEDFGALRINNKVPIWSFASQSVPLDGREVKKIRLSGYIKSKNVVQGAKNWQMARVNIEFKDGKGKRIGGWPILDAFTGTFDWKKVSQTFAVPKDTRRVDVFAGLLECRGEAWFDGLKLEGFTATGKRVKAGGEYVTNTKGWNKFYPKPDDFNPDAAPDVSFLLDPPAGKHGFMKIKDGHFYFEDGTRVRFWGTNIYAPSTFPSKEDAEKMAKRLAKFGCNLVRIHHIDAFWANPNIFDPNYNDTQHLSAEALDRMDYLIYQLEKHGIYVFMDLLVDREFKEGDNVVDYKNVERGAKITGFFNSRIIDLQKKYARDLLLHYNPYTKKRYIDDPGIVSVKLINEAMLFYIGTQFGLSKYYLDELDDLFNKWLRNKHGNRNNLKKAWTDKYGRCDLTDEEDPAKGNVKRADTPLKYQRGGSEKREPYRLKDTLKFYEELQVKYFKEMESYLKSLGLKVPVSGSNHWVNLYADVKSNAVLDYIDRHRYWDHPQFGYGTQIVFEDQPMVKDAPEALPNNFAFYKVKDKPFVVSEWNCAFPNEYRVEGPIIMAAYANLQDWDGVLQFSFNHAGWVAPMEDNFDISAWPNVFAQWPAAALLFYREDVKEAQNVIEQVLDEKDLYGPLNEDEPILGDPLLPLISKTQISFQGESVPGRSEQYYRGLVDKDNKRVVSDTGDLTWNWGQGIFKIDTDKTQASIGFLKGVKMELQDVTFVSETNFCSLALSSLDDRPISESSKLLLTAGARIENKGQVYNKSKTQLKVFGKPLILWEGINSKVTLKREPKAVYALDINGKRLKKIKLYGDSFRILPQDQAFFYEIVF